MIHVGDNEMAEYMSICARMGSCWGTVVLGGRAYCNSWKLCAG